MSVGIGRTGLHDLPADPLGLRELPLAVELDAHLDGFFGRDVDPSPLRLGNGLIECGGACRLLPALLGRALR
jgi:hypothetical protein